MWATVVATSGSGRAALVVGCTALTSGLLLVAISVMRLGTVSDRWGPTYAGDHLFAPIADPGTRGGSVLAILLLTLPLLLLLDQAVRLGSSVRHRRYTALAVAGATGRDIRQWGTIEVGVPAAVGALMGVPVWLVLREVLGRGLLDRTGALVPLSVGPGAWVIAVVLGLAGYGVVVGRRSSSRMVERLSRSRGDRHPPRPWIGLLLVVSGCAAIMGYLEIDDGPRELPAIASVVLLVAGIAGLSPWMAYTAAGWMGRRAGSAPVMLATGRLKADPRPAARAAAAVGAVALTGGVLSAFIPDVISTVDDTDEYLGPAMVVAACALVAVVAVAGSLAVHSTETVLERRREMAAMVATGIPARTVSDSQRLECLIATLPLTVLGSVLGGFGYGYLGGIAGASYLWVCLGVLVTTGVVVAAVMASTAVMRPWLLRAVDWENVRTE